MNGTSKPRAKPSDKRAAESRKPSGRPPEDADEAVDPLAPGGSLFDEEEDAVEPNEPA